MTTTDPSGVPPQDVDRPTNGTHDQDSPAIRGEVIGLPSGLSPDAQLALLDTGRCVAVSDGPHLTVYSLDADGPVVLAQPTSEHRLPGIITAIAPSTLGLVAAVRGESGSAVLLLCGDEDPIALYQCSHGIAQLAVADGEAYIVEEGQPAPLSRVGLRDRVVAARIRLDHSDVRLEPRLSGGIVVTDRRARAIRVLSADLREDDEATPWRTTPPASAPCSCHEPIDRPKGCGCRPHPVCDDEPTKPPSHGEVPGSRPSGERPHPEGGTGGVAVPTPGGGVVVGNGDKVDHHHPSGSGLGPCGRSLLYVVDILRRVGPYFLAADAGTHTMSLLSSDMNLLGEWSGGRGGMRVLTAPDSIRILMLRSGELQWSWTDVHTAATLLRPDLVRPIFEVLDSKTFYGGQTQVLSYGQPTTPTKVKALLLPVVEGDQTFSSPDMTGFAAYVQRTVAPRVRDYYVENSFGQLSDITVDVFGGNAGPVAGPLKLPRAKVLDYYFPTYDPARVELTRAGLSGGETVEFDGRESLVLDVKPLDGGPEAKTIAVPFFALGFRLDIDHPEKITFVGTERLRLDVTLPNGTAKSVTLSFTPKTIDFEAIDINVQGQLDTTLNELEGYLDDVMKAAEAAAGIAPRAFAAPKAERVKVVGRQFGTLVVTFASATTVGAKLRVTSWLPTLPGLDPLGLAGPLLGTIPVSSAWQLDRYLDVATLLGQDAAGAGFTERLLNPPTATVSASALTTRFAVSDRFGGPGAVVSVKSNSGLETLFTSTKAVPNSATTFNLRESLRDRSQFYQNAFSAAIQRLRDKNLPTDLFKDYTCVLILPITAATPNPSDPNAVLPSEVWHVTPLNDPFGFRGAENVTTVVDTIDDKIQKQCAWALIFMPGGVPDTPMTIHEVGHALGFADLYFEHNYRDELAYLGDWAMMDNHPLEPHHCGYHKLQARWIPEGAGTEKDYGRVLPLGLPDADAVRTWEFLLVPVELWRDSLVASARAAFAMRPDTPVVQLGWIDFGGDGATFGLIEARQPGARYSKNLPVPTGGVLITNCIAWTLDQRFATNTFYRRPVQFLNPFNVLRNPGDSFDLARAPELAVKGMTVEVVATQVVEGDAQVYRVKVTRQNAEFVDLYFESPPVYYKNPDLWVDWQADNKPKPENLVPSFGLGQPTDQGQTIYVPNQRTVEKPDGEPHWVVARLRNRGQVKATDVKLNFFYFEPPGAGDGQKPMDVNNLSAYHLIGSVTQSEVPAGDKPELILRNWNVPPGFGGHTCLLVQIEDYRIPEDSSGAALGSDDTWIANNHAQKNVSKFEATKNSPFAPIEFDFSVRNEGVGPEVAYLEPDGLPLGMTLTVTPPIRTIPAASTVRFHCMLELDDAIIEAGCENDQRFRIHAWRQDTESSTRWGGVEYEIRPRQLARVTLTGSWDDVNNVELTGTVTPDPGGGQVRLRMLFGDHPPQWVFTSAQAGGAFSWKGKAPDDSFVAEAVAWFAGNRTFSSARSAPTTIKHPPVIH